MSEGAGPTEMEDARLVRLAREGDADAFERLVRRHLRVAHGVALKRTGDPHDAEDVCQDAFLTALERIESCRHPERFRSWLLTIVRNTALNRLDRERRRSGASLDVAAGVASGDDPHLNFRRGELRDELGRAIAELPEMQRKVLILHDYEGWSHPEIGEKLGIVAGTARYHLHTARKAMRSLLEKQPEPQRESDR